MPLQLFNRSYAFACLMLEEQANSLNIGLYVLLAMTVLVLVGSFLQYKRKTDSSTQLQALEALRTQVLNDSYSLILEALENKIDDKIRSVLYAMQADLATRQNEVQHNFESLQAGRTKDRDEM